MKTTPALCVLIFCCFAMTAQGFDIHTHTAMTAKAVEQSKFGSTPNTSALLKQLGLRDADGIFGVRYVGFGIPLRLRNATTWEQSVMKAVREELKGARLDIFFVVA